MRRSLQSHSRFKLLLPNFCLFLSFCFPAANPLCAAAESLQKSLPRKKIAARNPAGLRKRKFVRRQFVRRGKITVKRIAYRGWRDALVIGNGLVEAVVVPSINRVMQFRFVGEAGVFWENDALAGEAVEASAVGWKNFGGDKTWVAPQSDWLRVTNRKTPIVTFNAMPAAAFIKNNGVELVSQIDEDYGILARRLISLDKSKPVMTIETVYEKRKGEPQTVSVWTITQLKDPRGIFIPVSPESNFESSFIKLRGLPPSLKLNDGVLSLTRDEKASHKIGADSDRMIWIDDCYVLTVAAPRVRAAAYPDGGSSVEVYTSQNPLAYVELEILSPLGTMRVGGTMRQTNAYALRRRSTVGIDTEVKNATKDKLNLRSGDGAKTK